MKKDIFNGKIKKEYYSYILVYMIFFALLFVVGGALCVYAFVSEGSFNVSGERALLVVFGGVFFVLGGGYVFPQLFVIRNFPKYPKLRRIMLNSDIYFTDSTSNEYYGRTGTLRGRRNKAAFDLVTTVADLEAGLGDKKPIRYTVYSALVLIMSVLGLAWLFAVPLLFENGTIFPNMSDGTFAILLIAGAFVCVAIAIFFLVCACRTAERARVEKEEWRSELYSSLADISIRQNNKKHNFWYDADQLEQIENLVKSASENAELKLETKMDKLVSFKVMDTLYHCVVFKGLFT